MNENQYDTPYPVLVRMSLITGKNAKYKLLYYAGHIFIIFYFLSEVSKFPGIIYLALLCYLIPDTYAIYWVNKYGDWDAYSKQLKPKLEESFLRWIIILFVVIATILLTAFFIVS